MAPRTAPGVRARQAPPTIADYTRVRRRTEALAQPLSAEDQTVQSMPDVSPTKWHRGHTTWFFETFLLTPNRQGYRLYDDRFGFLFNSYYEAVGDRHPRAQRGLLSRPGVDEVAGYRAHVDEAMAGLLGTDMAPDAAWLVELGLHHEQQHQELLLMDIKHVLSVNPLRSPYLATGTRGAGANPPVRWIGHDEGIADIGHDGDGFSFDNELPRHSVYLQPFAVADRPVTCGDWCDFIADGGYTRPELWLSDGWAAVNALGQQAPLYWERDGAGWQVFTLGGLRPVDAGEPVCHISYYEADAYAHWAGARLPTEAEWETAVGRLPHVAAPGPAAMHPRPVAEVESPGVGQVWEWTASAYLPYPGFHPAAGAVGEYNGKFMVGQHVLRGGCVATPDGHYRPTYRNFFPPSSRWPFTGARLARDL